MAIQWRWYQLMQESINVKPPAQYMGICGNFESWVSKIHKISHPLQHSLVAPSPSKWGYVVTLKIPFWVSKAKMASTCLEYRIPCTPPPDISHPALSTVGREVGLNALHWPQHIKKKQAESEQLYLKNCASGWNNIPFHESFWCCQSVFLDQQ